MRILLTGGSGFIGSHLAERLLKDNHEVVSIDNLSTGSLENNHNLVKNDLFCHHTSELLSEEGIELLKKEILKCDVIYHLAVAVGVFNVVNHPAKTIKENIEITEIILDFAKDKNKKLYFSQHLKFMENRQNYHSMKTMILYSVQVNIPGGVMQHPNSLMNSWAFLITDNIIFQ